MKAQVRDRVITISISVNPFQYTAQTNLAAGTWLCFAHRSSDLNSKHAVWVVLDAFLGPSARALMQNAALGEFWEGYAWVRLDLVIGIMGWIMQANQRMEWRSAGLCENGNRIRIAVGKCYSKYSSIAFMLGLRGE